MRRGRHFERADPVVGGLGVAVALGALLLLGLVLLIAGML